MKWTLIRIVRLPFAIAIGIPMLLILVIGGGLIWGIFFLFSPRNAISDWKDQARNRRTSLLEDIVHFLWPR